MPVEDVLMELELNVEGTIEHLQNELRGVRTGRASPALVEHIKVEYYGSLTDLKAIAAISVPEATQIVVKPFQKSDLKAIEKAIGDSKMGLTPHSDGTLLRINLPPMSLDRRKQLASHCKKYGEEAKIQLRNHRREANKTLDSEQKDGTLTEDELERGREAVDELAKKLEAKIEEIVAKKQSEIMDV
jgi:ribosome recycling factor